MSNQGQPQPVWRIVQTLSDIEELTQELKATHSVAFDTETTGVDKGSQIIGASFCTAETHGWYIITAYWDAKAAQLIEVPVMREALVGLLKLLPGKQLIAHNAIFDCSMIDDNYKVSLIDSVYIDTMILAHLLDENNPVGLKDLGNRFLHDNADAEAKEVEASIQANGGKITKGHYELYRADSSIIAKYGAKDAWMTYMLLGEFLPRLYDEGLDTFFFEESMPLLRGPTYEMNTTGLCLDQVAMTTLKKTLEAECAELKTFIYSEIDKHIKAEYPGTSKKNTFNLGSNVQMSWLLFGVLNLEFTTLTDAGKQACKDLGMKLPYSPGAKRQFIAACLAAEGSIQKPGAIVNGKTIRPKKFKAPWSYIAVGKKVLPKYAPRYKWIESLTKYNKNLKLLSTYIEGIESRVKYGIIRPSFLQHGTSSGRYASRSPNFQNLPRDDKRIKACIVSRPGKVFVGADYSQLEPRVFAYFSNDERLLKAFKSADDFYSVIGMEVFNKTDCVPRKDGSPDAFGIKYKSLRDLSKVIALASTYGATAFQLAPTTGKSTDDTAQDIENYFEAFPGVRQMMLDSHKQAKTQGYVTNLFGRKRRMPAAMKIEKLYGKQQHADLPYEARSLLNLAVNHQIQSTGASICNRAMIKFYEDVRSAGIEGAHLVLSIHDENIVECWEKDAENVAILLQNAMETAVLLPTVDLEAVPKYAKTLADLK
jgi:DNA polymerase I-like protein with 3'-5' exonuclease and polymerase domains